MHRLRVLLGIAAITFAVLYACEQGHFQSSAPRRASARLSDWKPAAEREVTDRPEDAFQRAWNSSERRVDRALEKADSSQ